MTRGRMKQPKADISVLHGYKFKHTVIAGAGKSTLPIGKGKSTIASLRHARRRLERLIKDIDKEIRKEESTNEPD